MEWRERSGKSGPHKPQLRKVRTPRFPPHDCRQPSLPGSPGGCVPGLMVLAVRESFVKAEESICDDRGEDSGEWGR